MTNVFFTILKQSITASYIALCAIVFRLVFKKAPKAYRIFLWALVGIRLLIPFSIQSALSALPANETHTPSAIDSTLHEFTYGNNQDDSYVHYAQNSIPDASNEPIPDGQLTKISVQKPVRFTEVLPCIWLVGMAGMLIYAAVSYFLLYRMTAEKIPYKDNVYYCEKVNSPFILGIFRPKIYLPLQITDKDRENVLLHENMHLRHLDHLIKPFAYFILSVYWFNPVMWLSYVLLCRDIELICDERVIRKMGNDFKKSYSESLVNLSAERSRISACPLSFGENSTKNRVKNVLKYKKSTLMISICAAVICIAVGIALMTVPKAKNTDALSSDTAASQKAGEEYSDEQSTDDTKPYGKSLVYKVEKQLVYNACLNQECLYYSIENEELSVGCPNGKLDLGSFGGNYNLKNGISTNDMEAGIAYDYVSRFSLAYSDETANKVPDTLYTLKDKFYKYYFTEYDDNTALFLVFSYKDKVNYAALLSPTYIQMPSNELDRLYSMNDNEMQDFLTKSGVTLPTEEYFRSFYAQSDYNSEMYPQIMSSMLDRSRFTLYYARYESYLFDKTQLTAAANVDKAAAKYYGLLYEHTGKYKKLGEGYLYKNHPDKLLEIGVIQTGDISYELVVKDGEEYVSYFPLDTTHGGEDSYYLYKDIMLFEYDPYAIGGFGYFSYVLFQLDDEGYMVPSETKYIEFRFDEYSEATKADFPEVNAFLTDAKKRMDESKLLFTTCEAIKRGNMY